MKSEIINLLLIEDEKFDVRRIKSTLNPFVNKIKVIDIVSNGKDALKLIARDDSNYDVVIMDYQISGSLRGEQLIMEMKKFDSTLQIIVLTKLTINQTDLSFANKLIESGAFWLCTKYPVDIEDQIYQPTDLVLSILNAFEKRKLELDRMRSKKRLKKNVQSILSNKPIIGQSEAIQNVKKLITQCAESDASILITGESGTGKELVTINIHYSSARKYENLVTINCGAIPENLIESELFGFIKGSFTDAGMDRLGLFEQADGGTIFLDEISELPLSAQTKLLRVLQNGEIDKIGRKKKYKVDVRVIAATNKDLNVLLKHGKFREDLFYRVNVLQIDVPPLRERRDEIPPLTNYFMDFYSKDMGKVSPVISKSAMEMLVRYNWPGNIRQLKNIIQRLLIANAKEISELAIASAIGIEMPDFVTEFASASISQDKPLILKEADKKFRKMYLSLVRQNSKSDAEAARKLGLAPPNYHRMCKELGLK